MQINALENLIINSLGNKKPTTVVPTTNVKPVYSTTPMVQPPVMEVHDSKPQNRSHNSLTIDVVSTQHNNHVKQNSQENHIDNSVKVEESQNLTQKHSVNLSHLNNDIDIPAFLRTLVPNVDFSNTIIPNKRILLKRGAIKFLKFANYRKSETLVESTTDSVNSYASYVVRVDIINLDGEIVTSCLGTANTYEAKFKSKQMSSSPTVLAMAAKRALIGAVKELLIH